MTINKALWMNDEPRYTVYYHDGSAAGNDFAKQLLVMIGTLMTSVTSFYFATKSSSPASSPVSGATTPAAELTGVTPSQGTIGSTLGLEVAGNNLGEVNEVKLVRGNQELTGTDLGVSARLLECNVALPAGTEVGEWTIRATDKGGRKAELKNAITLRQS